MLYSTVLTVLSLAAYFVTASPAHKGKLSSTHKSSQAPASSILPFSNVAYSQAAGLCQQTYCLDGAIGQQVGDARLIFTTGDGSAIQRANIYYSASLGLTLAYQGTNISSLASTAHDLQLALKQPDPLLGLPAGARVNDGFQSAWLASYPSVLKGLEQARAQFPGSKLVVVGHSLGASQALLAGLALQRLYKIDGVITFGLPRTGNDIFANAVDSLLAGKFSYVVNGRDWVPHTPFSLLGYQHPSGQVWINPSNTTNWASYPGQENVNGSDSVVIPQASFDDHQGVYFHTQIGAHLGHCPATVGQD